MDFLKRENNIAFLSLGIFFICLVIGFSLTPLKPLWRDEIYSQYYGVERIPVIDLLLARQKSEGNVSPLFFIVQKGICAMTGYRLPPSAVSMPEKLHDPFGQWVLRINPIVFMSAAMAMIFYFFSRWYSHWHGLYSLGLSLSSFMVWAYWLEARQYGLWVFLTSLQLILVLYIFLKDTVKRKVWLWLFITNFLLSLTVVFGCVQMAASALVIGLFYRNKWKEVLFVSLIPISICLFYYLHSPQYKFWFWHGPMQLISASLSKDRMLIILIYTVIFIWYLFRNKLQPLKVQEGCLKKDSLGFLILTHMMFLSAVLLLALFKFKVGSSAGGKEGFPISNRYFIYLMPIGIMAVTIFSFDLLALLKGRRLGQVALVLVLLAILVLRAYKTAALAGGIY